MCVIPRAVREVQMNQLRVPSSAADWLKNFNWYTFVLFVTAARKTVGSQPTVVWWECPLTTRRRSNRIIIIIIIVVVLQSWRARFACLFRFFQNEKSRKELLVFRLYNNGPWKSTLVTFSSGRTQLKFLSYIGRSASFKMPVLFHRVVHACETIVVGCVFFSWRFEIKRFSLFLECIFISIRSKIK